MPNEMTKIMLTLADFGVSRRQQKRRAKKRGSNHLSSCPFLTVEQCCILSILGQHYDAKLCVCIHWEMGTYELRCANDHTRNRSMGHHFCAYPTSSVCFSL
ncbi:hypothetical protein AHF37_03478 [Paragonimus kellicotti]|nr:hypothetical protein AHF37_03478 [Paragonimus kellicotti]